MADEVSKHILKYEVDKQSTQAVAAETQKLEARLDALRVSTDALAPGAVQASSALKRLGDGQLVRSLEDARDAVADAKDELAELRRSALEADRALSHSRGAEELEARLRRVREETDLYGDIASRISAFSGLTSSLGGTGLSSSMMIGADIFDVIEAAPRLQAELGVLGEKMTSTGMLTTGLVDAVSSLGVASPQAVVGLGAVAVGVGAVYLAAKQFSDSLSEWGDLNNQATQAVNSRIEAYKRYDEFIVSATFGDIQQEIANSAQQYSILVQQQQDLTELKRTVDRGLDTGPNANMAELLGEGALRAYNALGGNAAGLKDLEKALSEIDGQMQATGVYLGMLTDGLANNATAANDAAAAEKKRTNEYLATLERDTQAQIEYDQMRRTWSSEQLEAELDRITSLKAAYEAMLPELERLSATSPEAAQKLEYYRDQIYILGQRYEVLTTTVQPVIEATERQAEANQAAADAADALVDATQKTAKSIEEQAQRLAKAEALRTQYADDTDALTAKRDLFSTRETEDFLRKRGADQARHYSDLASLDVKYRENQAKALEDLSAVESEANEERLDALKDHNKEDLRLAKEHSRKIEDVQRQMSKGIEDAVLARDVSAAIAAIERGEEQSKEENKQYAAEADRRDEHFQDRIAELDDQRQEKLQAGRKQLDDLRTQHNAERQSRITAFANQLAQEDQERRIRLQRQQQDWQIEDAARQANFQKQLDALTVAQANERTARTVANDAVLADTSNWVSRMIATAKPLSAASASSNTTPMSYTASSAAKLAASTMKSGLGFGDGGFPPPGTVVDINERRPESAVFLGNWQVFPHQNMKTLGTMGGTQYSFDMSGWSFASGVDAAGIQSVFEQAILPKIVESARQAGQGGTNVSLRL